MTTKIIPETPETLQGGMNTYDSAKVLTPNVWQLIENSYPGITGKPRNGINELKADTAANGYLSNPSFFRPRGIHVYAGLKDFIFTWMRTDHASYKDEYSLEVWNLTDNTRAILEYAEFNSDLVFFGFQKLYNGVYAVMDYAIKTNHTSAYRTKNLILEYVGSAWTVRSMSIDCVPSLENISTGDVELAKFDTILNQHASVVYNNKMWVIGGKTGATYSNKVYYSSDGVTWTEAGYNSIPYPIAAHAVIVFNDKLWIIGGIYDTGAAVVTSRKVYYSTDGITWTEAGTDALPVATYGHIAFSFLSKMWVLGGRDIAAYQKVYYSTDGITWTEAGTDALPDTLYGHSGIVANSKMWIFGGIGTDPSAGDRCYYSSNGSAWTEAGSHSLPVDLAYHTSVYFLGKYWIIGGLLVGSASRKVYYSTDGITWTEAGTDALPVAKQLHTSVVYKNRMWAICGNDYTIDTKTIYSSSSGTSWTQELGGMLQNYFSSVAITFVKRSTFLTYDTSIFEEPINESMEDLGQRQIIKMLCTTTTGTLLIPMPLNYANAVAQGATHMRIFRTLGNADEDTAAGLDHLYLIDIAITGGSFSVTTIYHDFTPDSTLEGETHILDTTGYEVSPQGRFMAWADGRNWIYGNPSSPGYAFCSIKPINVASPQKYASMFSTKTLYVTCDPYDGQKDTGMKVLGGDLYFFKERKIFILENGNADNIPRKISSTIGCACSETLVEADIPQLGGQCLLFESESGPAILLPGGSLRLLSEFRISELWPNRTGILKLASGLPTDWYTRNKVTSEFWNNTWWIFYGDSRDAECGLTANKCFGFRFNSDNENVGAFQHTFPQYVYSSTGYTIYEPQMLISIDNIRAYTFSHKANKDGNIRYRITRFLDPSKWQDTYVTEGAISYAMQFRPRYQYVGPLRSSLGQIKLLVLYLSYVDTDAISLNIYIDGSRLTIPCTMVIIRQSGMAVDNTFRNAIAVKLQDVPRGSFFDYLLSKTVPTTGAVEFFGGEFLAEDVQAMPSEEFMSFCGAMTGSITYIREVGTSPEVTAYP